MFSEAIPAFSSITFFNDAIEVCGSSAAFQRPVGWFVIGKVMGFVDEPVD